MTRLEPRHGQEVLRFSKMSNLVLGPIQTAVQWVVGFFRRVKHPGREAIHTRICPVYLSGEQSTSLPFYNTYVTCHYG